MSNADFGILFLLLVIVLQLSSINRKMSKFLPDDESP
jgi:hypothetical protein